MPDQIIFTRGMVPLRAIDSVPKNPISSLIVRFKLYLRSVMPWTNFHSHTYFCDGKDTPGNWILAAENVGMVAYGISSHAPVPYEVKWCMKRDQLPAYIGEVNALKGQSPVQVYLGLEVDFVPGVTGPNHPDFAALDYTIGSVHLVDFFPDGMPWEIDGPHTLFLKGLEEIFQNDVRAAVCRYFELTRMMVRDDCPDIVGHMDKIKMQNEGGRLFDESADWYRAELLQTLEEIAATQAIIEVNTRGIYKKRTDEPYPGRWALERIFEMGIPVQINSDSHHPSEILWRFPETAALLKEIGFSQLRILLDGEWQDATIDGN
jgi:histidinol-phosphatase (PHP family)